MGCFYSTERVVLLSSIYKRKATQKKNYDRNYYCDCNYVLCIGLALLFFGLRWDVWSLTTIDIE